MPGAAVEETGFCTSGFAVDLTGAAERGWRRCVVWVNIIIFGYTYAFSSPRTLQYQKGHYLRNGPIYIQQ